MWILSRKGIYEDACLHVELSRQKASTWDQGPVVEGQDLAAFIPWGLRVLSHIFKRSSSVNVAPTGLFQVLTHQSFTDEKTTRASTGISDRVAIEDGLMPWACVTRKLQTKPRSEWLSSPWTWEWRRGWRTWRAPALMQCLWKTGQNRTKCLRSTAYIAQQESPLNIFGGHQHKT